MTTDWVTTGLAPRQAPFRLDRRTRAWSRALDRESPLRRVDWLLNLAVLGMTSIGALLVWSATRQRMLDIHGDPNAFLKKGLLNLGLGICLAVGVSLVDYRTLRAYAPVLYGASILGEMAVLSPLGSTINGAHSWIVLGGGFQLQPAEFAKVATVVVMAMLLAERRDGEAQPRTADIFLVLVIAAVPMGMIMLQPDFGTTMVFVFTVLGVLACSGASSRWVGGLVAVGVVGGALILQLHLLKPYQQDRLTNFANPSAAVTASGYNVDQAKTAIGSGGVLGKGLFHGTQTKGGFVPEQQTDFVFTVAGEELGFVGAATVLVLLGLVLSRAVRIARLAADPFGTLVAAGVVSWFAFQSFTNIGMTLGIMPVAGVPLPFVSYGGSSMFANMIAIGLLQNVALSRREV